MSHRMILYIVVVLSVGALHSESAGAAYYAKCSDLPTDLNAFCPSQTVGSECDFMHPETGVQKEGSVVYLTADEAGGAGAGYYCKVPGIAAAPICPDGKVILHNDAIVGCLFNKFGPAEKTHCEGSEVIGPAGRFGGCWVCIQEEKAVLVSEQSSWSELRLSDGSSGAKEADFSCLRGALVKIEDDWATRPALVRPDFDGELFVDGCRGKWTSWLNRDTPGGSGDYEGLRDHVQAGKACSEPSAIECRTRAGVASDQTGERVHCDVESGGYCVNREQAGGNRCSDYEVRFCC